MLKKALIACLLVFPPFPVFAYEAVCETVLAGDHLKLKTGNKTTRVRLYGIAVPDKQKAFSQEAKAFTTAQVAGKTVEVVEKTKDKHGRQLVVIYIEGRCLNAELLRQGYAWVYWNEYKEDEWYEMEREAKEKKIGVWSLKHTTHPGKYGHRR